MRLLPFVKLPAASTEILNIQHTMGLLRLTIRLMNRYWIVIFIASILLATPGQPVQPKSALTAEEEIRHLLADQVEAWNKGDLTGFMNGYWRSPELTFFSGVAITKGWDPTLERYQQRYKGE